MAGGLGYFCEEDDEIRYIRVVQGGGEGDLRLANRRRWVGRE